MPILSIVIVNYKSWTILQKNIEALLSYDFEEFELEIIVIDNCSNDGKFSEFKSKFPGIHILENEGNWGFAHACNLGASLAKGNILLFLNPDTLASKAAISEMYSYYSNNSDIGILSCKQSEKLSSFQKIKPSIYTLFGPQRSIYKLIYSKKIKNMLSQDGKIITPDWISGSVVMISKFWFDKVGGWNTDYWMYSEDVELSIKVKEAGGLLKMLTKEKIVHEHGISSRINPITTALTKSEVIISNHVYIQNNFSNWQKIPSHFLLICNTLVFKSILGLIGLVLFFIPKAKVQFLILKNCLAYYFSALGNQTWISPRSFNYLKK